MDESATADERPPWLARPDWTDGRVVAERGRLMVVPWFALALSIFLFVPSIWFVWQQIESGLESLDLRFFVLVAFALFAFWFFGRMALVPTRQALRFGPAVLHLESVPVPIGRELRGTIAMPVALRPGDRVRLELECVATTPTGGNDASTSRTVWRETREVPAETVAPTAEGSAVPVRLPVAAHMHGTGRNDTGSTRWSLTARLLPGRRWQETFDLPIFRTADSPVIEEAEPPKTLREAYEWAKGELAAGRLHYGLRGQVGAQDEGGSDESGGAS